LDAKPQSKLAMAPRIEVNGRRIVILVVGRYHPAYARIGEPAKSQRHPFAFRSVHPQLCQQFANDGRKHVECWPQWPRGVEENFARGEQFVAVHNGDGRVATAQINSDCRLSHSESRAPEILTKLYISLFRHEKTKILFFLCLKLPTSLK